MLNNSLTEATFRDLRDYIYENSGIYIADTKKYLIENRLARILEEKNIDSYEEYYKFIKYTLNKREIDRLFDAITTNETYFFREPEQFHILVDHIIPRILENRKVPQRVKIWSAACSSGEEPYTLTMMLLEKRQSEKFEIYASDLSDGVLTSAKKAIYTSYSVRNIPEIYLKKYFSNSGQSYTLDSTISNMVKFHKINLIDEKQVRTIRAVDIILCRNVLIYFDPKAKQRVVSQLYNSLNPGGYLIIGSSESLHSVTRAFRPSVTDKVIIYQKV